MFKLTRDPKILLLLPTTDTLLFTKNRQSFAPAYGLNILATAFHQAGMETIVLDECTMRFHPELADVSTWQDALTALLDYYTGIRLVGFSVLTNFRKEVAMLSRYIRQVYPQISIVWGGAHVTALGPDLLNAYADLCDVMVVGPVDATILRQLVEPATMGRPSRSILLRGDHRSDIAHTVIPNYVHYVQFMQQRLPKLIVRTTSGCPTPSCTFCSAAYLDGRYTPATPEIAARRVCSALSFDPLQLEFHDQDLFYDFHHMERILHKVTLDQVTHCYCHAGIDSITSAHIDLLRQTHPDWTVFVGLESASAKVYRLICKKRLGPQSLENLLAMIDYARGTNVKFGMFVMFGIPGEDQDDIRTTLEYIIRAGDVELSCSLMKVFPGTVIARQLIRQGQLSPDIWLDEDGPRVVAAIEGPSLQYAKENLLHVLTMFPLAQKHNQIDRELFGLPAFSE